MGKKILHLAEGVAHQYVERSGNTADQTNCDQRNGLNNALRGSDPGKKRASDDPVAQAGNSRRSVANHPLMSALPQPTLPSARAEIERLLILTCCDAFSPSAPLRADELALLFSHDAAESAIVNAGSTAAGGAPGHTGDADGGQRPPDDGLCR